MPKRQRNAGEHCRRRRHQDRAESQKAGFPDRIHGLHVPVTLGRDREIDEHDAVLLDDPDQQNDADDADNRKIHVPEIERKQRADAGRGKG